MKNKQVNNYIMEQLKEINETPQKRNKIIQDRVKEKFGIIIKAQDITYVLQLCKSQAKDNQEDLQEVKNTIDRLNDLFADDIPETKDVKWETYVILRIKRKEPTTWEEFIEPISISLNVIDEIYKDYTQHGNNLTGQQICDKYWLTGKAWNAIKGQLNLNKQCNIVSDITLNWLSDDEIEETIDWMTSEHISNRYKQKLKKAHDLKVKQSLQIVSSNEAFLKYVQSFIEKHEPIKLDFEIKKPANYLEKQYNLSDLHIGKVWTKAIIERLNYILEDIKNSKESIIYINCFGDLAETLTQEWMHPWQLAYWTEQEWGYWFDLMMTIVNIFEKFLLAINKLNKRVYFRGIPWNHDRLTQAKDMDVQKTWWLVIYEMLKRWLSNSKIQIDYLRETINTFTIGNLHYIISHWDWNFDKLSPEKVLVMYGDLTKYNLIFSWDKHHLWMREYPKCTWIKTPWLWWKGLYDKTNSYRSEPWYVIVQENQFKTADLQIKRLPNDY